MPFFSYVPNIPAAGNSPSVDQPNMKINTQSTNGILAVDLYGFGDPNGGYHQKSTYVDQVSDQGAISGADVVYSKTVNSVIELFLRRPTGSPIQLTTGNITASTNGSSFLPGGLIIQWGQGSLAGQGSSFTFPTAFPTNCFSLIMTCRDKGNTSASLSPNTISRTGAVSVFYNGNVVSPPNFCWIAIGN